MFKISEKQLLALKQAGADGFHERLCDFIVTEYNVEAARRPALEVGITDAIKDGHAFGLRTEKAVATYGVAAFLVGLQIKDDPKVCATLSSTSLSEAHKVEWLTEWLALLEKALDTPAHG